MILSDISPALLMSMPGATEMIIILVIVLLLFGAKKIPDLAKGIGKGMKEFKDAKDGNDDDTKAEEQKGSIK